MRRCLRRTILGTAGLAGSLVYLTEPGDAWAAATPVVPGSADAGRVLENLQPVPEPTLAAPPVTVAPQLGLPTPPGAAQALFLLNDVRVEGATVYDNRQLAAIFRPYLHQYLSVRKLYALTQPITQRYHEDGYALSKAVVPPQNLTEGRVRIQVVEGYIDAVQTQGPFRHSDAADTIIDRIKSYRLLKVKDLERDMLLLNDLPGVSVRAVLKLPDPSGGIPPPGASDLLLVFTDVAAPASVSLDNYGSRYTGPYEASFQAGLNHDVFGPYQQTVVSGATALPQSHELQTIQLSHRLLLDGQGTSATLQAAYAHTEPGYQLTSSEIVSDAYNYGVSVSHPLLRSRSQNYYVSGDVVIKDITADALDTPLYHDKLTIVSVAGSGEVADPWGGANLAQVKLSQGLNLLGATRTGTPDLSRANGHSDFIRLSATLSRLQAVTDTVRLYAAGSGQYSWSPLLSSEQFGYGGQQFGRAYDPAVLTGDDGVAGLVELRYSPPLSIPHVSSELYTFYDIGRVWTYHDTASMQGGASAGIGWRFAYGPHLFANLSLAQPLTGSVTAPAYGNGKAPRALFSLNIKN